MRLLPSKLMYLRCWCIYIHLSHTAPSDYMKVDILSALKTRLIYCVKTTRFDNYLANHVGGYFVGAIALYMHHLTRLLPRKSYIDH